MNHLKLLDCTLRDGGYLNDWNFTRECYDQVSTMLQTAGVDFIELGIIGNHQSSGFKTKFRSLEEIPVPENFSSTQFTVMMTGNEYQKLSIPVYRVGMIPNIRFAFFKADWKTAIRQMAALMEKGYHVFAQSMATFQYSPDELENLIQEANQIRPYAFYLVDSFGTFYNEDVNFLYDFANEKLGEEIVLGFHAHNNLQMANANAIAFINQAKGRKVLVDGSIYGMGRGAGNANTELLMHYLNQHGKNYQEDIVWGLYDTHFASLKKEFSWGYLPEQFLVSKYRVNPAYVWYLSQKGITDLPTIKKILKQIPPDKGYTLYRDIVDDLLQGKAEPL